MLIARSSRVPLTVPVTYRTVGDHEWLQSHILNLSDSGVLFGPTTVNPGAELELVFSTPVQVGSIAPGKLVCLAEVVRSHQEGVVAAKFDDVRFLLET